MRYSLCLLFAMLVVSCICGCERKPQGLVVARINERAIALDEFMTELQKSIEIDPEFTGAPEDVDRLVDEIITREVLIQEAMRRGLDREEDFRWEIRKYYEQTLIEKLMRTELDAMRVDVSGQEIEDRYSLMGKVYRMDMAEIKAPGSSGRCLRADGDLWQKVTGRECLGCHEVKVSAGMEVMPEYLPGDFADAVRSLRPGEVSGPLPLGKDMCFVRLGGSEQVPLPPLPEVREKIKASLVKRKKAEMLEKWLEDLKGAAAISVDREAVKGER